MTSYSAAPPSARWERALFRMSRSGVIALVVVLVLMLAGAGLLAGALLQRDTPELVTKPMGVSLAPTSRTLLALAPRAGQSVVTAGRWGRTDLSPSVIPSPSATTGAPDEPAGETIDLGPGTVRFALIQPWTVISLTDRTGLFGDGLGNRTYLQVGHTDPGTDAADLLEVLFPTIITSDYYTQLQTGEVEHRKPEGRASSLAVVAYSGLFLDQQGASRVLGNFWTTVRDDDGAYLVGIAESTPPESFTIYEFSWRMVINAAYASFNGTG